MSQPAADRNLLFGILALQMDFIGRDALVAAMNAWVLDKAKPLGPDPASTRGAARPRPAARCWRRWSQEHLQQHGDDPQQSLAAVSVAGVRPRATCSGRRPGRAGQPGARPSPRRPDGDRRDRAATCRPTATHLGRASASCGRTPRAAWARSSSPTTRS